MAAAAGPLPEVRAGRGPLRWRLLAGLAVAGLALFGAGLTAGMSTDSDPYVPLIVESGPNGDGRCVVSWREEDTDAEHFVDLPCAERLIDAPDEYGFRYMDGWVIAHGPFKGDLYNADLEGTQAFTAYGIGMIAGGLLFLGSAGTLAVRWSNASRRRNTTSGLAFGVSQGGQPRVSLSQPHAKDGRYGWAALSAAATEQAQSQPTATNPRGPAPSDGSAPWWRIRPLVEMAGIRQLGVSASAFAAVLVAFTVTGSGSWIIVALMCGMFLAAGARTVRAARVARTLVKDAASEPQQAGRYVLLREGATHAPWAVYFSTGSEDTPFAAQPLLANQALPGPTGEVRLHGTADQVEILVPWIEGRPVWPAGDCMLLGVDLAEDRAFFDALIPN